MIAIKVNAEDVFDDDNKGYIYGVEYYDEETETVEDVEWFKTEAEQDNAVELSEKMSEEYYKSKETK